MFDPFYLCVIGVVLILFGLWWKITIYWYNKDRPHVSKWMVLLNDKFHNNERLSVWEYINLYVEKISQIIPKMSIMVGIILLIIGCISKIIN